MKKHMGRGNAHACGETIPYYTITTNIPMFIVNVS